MGVSLGMPVPDFTVKRAKPLAGEVGLPGDKTLTQLALVLGALSEGASGITGIGEGLDIEVTKNCLLRLGVRMDSHKVQGHEIIAVKGQGLKALVETDHWLECEDSVGTVSLLMGALAGQAMKTKISGALDLKRAPLGLIAEALRRMGAAVDFQKGEGAPFHVTGGDLKAISLTLVPSDPWAKAAVLVAGLMAEGDTVIDEPSSSWDHVERMLVHFGSGLRQSGTRCWVPGKAGLQATPVRLPGDMHLAGYWLAAASMVPESDLSLIEVGMNPCRMTFAVILDRMGASIERAPWEGNIIGAPEPVGDIRVKAAPLKGTDVSTEELAGIIDEIPMLAMAATQAKGKTRLKGIKKLGVEAEWLAKASAKVIRKMGGKAGMRSGTLTVTGPAKLKGAKIETDGDHRVAMATLVAGLVAEGETLLPDTACVDAAYPTFYDALKKKCS